MTKPIQRSDEEVQAALEALAISLHARQKRRFHFSNEDKQDAQASHSDYEAADLNLKTSSESDHGRDQLKNQVVDAFKDALRSLKNSP